MEELNRLSPEEFKKTQKTPVVVVLDNVRSAMNIGSVFRTADAFAVELICLCGITATPPNKEINKTALGSAETVAWRQFEKTIDAVTFLKEAGYRVYSVEQTESSIKLNKLPALSEKIALVFGNEVNGVDQEVIDLSNGTIEIPQSGTKHSLNISVAAGIVIWEVVKDRTK